MVRERGGLRKTKRVVCAHMEGYMQGEEAELSRKARARPSR